jgi:ArsR family transcriptional regulator
MNVDACTVADTSTRVNVWRLTVAKRASTPIVDDECCASVLQPSLSARDAEELSRAFAALADPVRLRVLNLIAAEDEVCACNLIEPIGRSQPTISHHTKTLADAGLIAGEKRGRWVWWRVVPGRLDALRSALR